MTGQKIFITSGHGKYHFVIARTEKADEPDDPFAGLGGLSMFLVPTYDDAPDGTRTRIVDHRPRRGEARPPRLGHRGAARSTARPPSSSASAARASSYMLLLMNNARARRRLRDASACARRRTGWRAPTRPSAARWARPIDRHEMIADYLDEMRTDIQGLRALAMHAARATRSWRRSSQLGGSFAPRRRRRARAATRSSASCRAHATQARRVTPLLKYLAAEKAVEIARRCIQIHGGVGYIAGLRRREAPARRAGDADLRGHQPDPVADGDEGHARSASSRSPQAFVARIGAGALARASRRATRSSGASPAAELSLSAQQHLLTRTAAGKLRSLAGVPLAEWPRARCTSDWDPKRDFAFAMLHAERLTRLLADEAIVRAAASSRRRSTPSGASCSSATSSAPSCARAALYDEITTGDLRILQGLNGASEPAHLEASK